MTEDDPETRPDSAPARDALAQGYRMMESGQADLQDVLPGVVSVRTERASPGIVQFIDDELRPTGHIFALHLTGPLYDEQDKPTGQSTDLVFHLTDEQYVRLLLDLARLAAPEFRTMLIDLLSKL